MKRIPNEDRAGFYLTVIVHLAVLIVLLASGIGYSLSQEKGYLLDFSKMDEMERLQAELERLQQELEFKEAISRKLQEELGGEMPYSERSSQIRNIAVNQGALRDDRGTDAEQLYADAERLRQELLRGQEISSEDFNVSAPEIRNESTKENERQTAAYSGPSVAEYDLGGRKASRLPIPAYRCMGSGKVKVLITVAPNGDVLSAKVDKEFSTNDPCLHSYAESAARQARFSANQGAAPKQSGYIIYQFVAQY